MPTVAEVLKQTGFTDEQIGALDPKLTTAFGSVLSTAENERILAQQAAERAEIERRSNAKFYDEQIAPALNQWGSERAQKDAELAFYKTQLESARTSGFVPSDAPGFEQPRDSQGRYLPNQPGGTPGSPSFIANPQEFVQRVGGAIGTLSDIQWRHQKLYGEPLPISPSQLIAEADTQRLDPTAYAERRFKFTEREQELAAKARQAEIDAAAAKAVAENDRKWAERIGSNPDVRMMQSSRFSDVSRAVKAGERPDPLMLDSAARKRATSSAIRQEIAEHEAA